MNPDRRTEKNIWQQVGVYTGLAMMAPAAAVIGLGIGYVLDQHWRTGRTFQVIFLLLGLAAGLIEVVRVAGRE